MPQPSLSELTERIRSLESQLQQMQEQYPVRSGQGAQDQVKYGDYRTVTDSIPPMVTPEVAQQELREGEQAQTDRRAAVAEADNLPSFDPQAWAEGTPDTARRQRVVQQVKERKARRQAQLDQQIPSQGPMDVDSQPPEAQLQAAQAFADEHRARVTREQGQPPVVRQTERQQRETRRGEHDQRIARQDPQPETEKPPQPPPRPPYQPNQPQPPSIRIPPYTPPPPDTSTQIPQPPDWKDTPERRAGGPVGNMPQQMTFGQAQASFDTAVARQMAMLAGFVQDATRRVEELECWRESMSQE